MKVCQFFRYETPNIRSNFCLPYFCHKPVTHNLKKKKWTLQHPRQPSAHTPLLPDLCCLFLCSLLCVICLSAICSASAISARCQLSSLLAMLALPYLLALFLVFSGTCRSEFSVLHLFSVIGYILLAARFVCSLRSLCSLCSDFYSGCSLLFEASSVRAVLCDAVNFRRSLISISLFYAVQSCYQLSTCSFLLEHTFHAQGCKAEPQQAKQDHGITRQHQQFIDREQVNMVNPRVPLGKKRFWPRLSMPRKQRMLMLRYCGERREENQKTLLVSHNHSHNESVCFCIVFTVMRVSTQH